MTAGTLGIKGFLKYELITTLFGGIPGSLGYYIRQKIYPTLFGGVGRKPIIGRDVVVRHPGKVVLGDCVTIDDYTVIDGRGSGDAGLVLENEVIVNRNCMLLAKAGFIRIGQRSNIGSNSVIVSMSGVDIGDAVLMAGGCTISAGAYHLEDVARPILDQGSYSKGPIRIGEGSRIGTGVIVLDGITIGKGAVVGPGSVITKDVPENAIVAGIPAQVIRLRG